MYETQLREGLCNGEGVLDGCIKIRNLFALKTSECKLRVLFIGLVLLCGFSLGSVDGSRAGDCRGLYPGSCKPYALRCMSR